MTELKRGRGRPPNPPEPKDRPEWEKQTSGKMERIIGKLLSQLERQVETIKPSQIPLAVAILTDKSALLSGRPTSMSATLTLRGDFNQDELRARLTGKASKTIKATAVDAKPRELGVGTQSKDSSLMLEQSVYPPESDSPNKQLLVATKEFRTSAQHEATVDIQSSVADSQPIDVQHP